MKLLGTISLRNWMTIGIQSHGKQYNKLVLLSLCTLQAYSCTLRKMFSVDRSLLFKDFELPCYTSILEKMLTVFDGKIITKIRCKLYRKFIYLLVFLQNETGVDCLIETIYIFRNKTVIQS